MYFWDIKSIFDVFFFPISLKYRKLQGLTDPITHLNKFSYFASLLQIFCLPNNWNIDIWNWNFHFFFSAMALTSPAPLPFSISQRQNFGVFHSISYFWTNATYAVPTNKVFSKLYGLLLIVSVSHFFLTQCHIFEIYSCWFL